MGKLPHISILIPVHNGEKYIGRCIRSALSQTIDDSDYEIIVVNDASTDNTLSALRGYEDNICLINNKQQLGLPGTLNVAIKAAKGQYVVRLDADDYVHKEYLNILSLHLNLNHHIDAIACDYILVDDDENVISQMDSEESPIACGIMFRIEQLIEIGLYDENFLACEEEDLRLRFEEKYKVDRVKLPLYRYRRHTNNMTNNKTHMQRYKKVLNKKHGIPE